MILPPNPESYQLLMEKSQSLSKEEQVGLARFLCQNDLFYLLRYVLSSRYILDKDGNPRLDHPWLFDRCREVQANPNGYLDIWAREHFKTTIISFGLTIFDILRNPEVTIGIFSDTRPLAKRILRQIKVELETNEILKSLFPDILWTDAREAKSSTKWSEDEGICVKRKTNPACSTVEAWGLVDGQPTGKHFQIRVYDDVVTRDNVTTPEQIAKTLETWELSLNLGTEGGVARYIGTRYHFNDLYHEVQKRGAAISRVYACMEPAEPTGQSVLFSQEYILEKFKSMGPVVFSAQMLCNPIAADNLGFDARDIQYYSADPVEEREGKTVYILCDPANEKKKDSDYTSFAVIGLGHDHNYYLLDLYRDRLGLHERANLLMQLHSKWKPFEVRYEKYGMQADIEYIRILQNQRKYRFPIVEVGGNVKKEDRIRRLIPLFKDRRFFFPEELYKVNYLGNRFNIIDELINEEIKSFPVGLHDDMIDAISRIAEPDLTLLFPKHAKYWEKANPYKKWFIDDNPEPQYGWLGA